MLFHCGLPGWQGEPPEPRATAAPGGKRSRGLGPWLAASLMLPAAQPAWGRDGMSSPTRGSVPEAGAVP